MLNPVAKKWVKALKSGKYKQGKNYLHTGLGTTKEQYHCCLGVLECLAVDGGLVKRTSRGGETLTPKVMKWAGLKSNLGEYFDVKIGKAASLAVLNDGDEYDDIKPRTFSQIARIIESEPEGLFKEKK